MEKQIKKSGFDKEAGIMNRAAIGFLKIVRKLLFLRTLRDPINTRMAIKFLDKVIVNFELEEQRKAV